MPGPTERSVRHQYYVRSSPEAVFHAVSEPEGLTRWLCDGAKVSRRPGGRYSLTWTDGPTHTGRVLEFLPGRRIALEWAWPDAELRGTIFSMTVEPAPDGALVRFEHSGFPSDEAWVDLYAGTEWGWTYFAMNLKSVLESGHDLRSNQDG